MTITPGTSWYLKIEIEICVCCAFSCGRRGTAKRWMRSYFGFMTPHPSAFGCHLPPLGKAYLVRPDSSSIPLTSTAFVDTKAKIFKIQLSDSIFSVYKYLSYEAFVSFFRYPHLHISSMTLLAVVYPIFKERSKIDVDMYFLF